MPENYILVTDDSCDLPVEYLQEHNISFVQLSFTIDSQTYRSGEMPIKEFYRLMREGKTPVTTQTNRQIFIDLFTPYLEKGIDVLYLAFSSGLSGTCASAQSATKELQEKFPERKIYVVDTLSASLGQGLFVHKVREKRDSGMSIDEVKDYAESLVPHLAHTFTVDDLMHLHRGGRVSKTAAIAGSMLGIKPFLCMDDEGHLIPVGKVRGRKQALASIVDEMEKIVGDTPNDYFMISHGDCLEDAEYVADLVKKRFGIEDYLINYVGPVIGTHSGPGTVALFMEAKRRKP